MKRLNLILILICLVFLVHCDNNGANGSREIVLEPKENAAGVEFSKVASTTVSGIRFASLFIDEISINVYGSNLFGEHSDKKDKILVNRYDRDLNFISQVVFPVGQGPGDLWAGSYFADVNNKILVLNHALRRISILDTNYKFIKFEKLLFNCMSPTFTRDGKKFFGFSMKREPEGYSYDFISATYPGLKRTVLYHWDALWLWNKQKKIIIGKRPVISYFIEKEKIYLVNGADYRMMMLDLDGKILKQVRVNAEKRKVPTEMADAWLAAQIGPALARKCVLTEEIQTASWAIPLGKGFAVVRRKDYKRECSGLTEADYFDFQLNYIGKILVPCFFQIFKLSAVNFPRVHGYDNGYLYLIYEDETDDKEEFHLEKWRVKE